MSAVAAPGASIIIEPATEGALGVVEFADGDAVDAAVARARAALPAWRAMAPGVRASLLRSWADAVDAEAASLAMLEARNAGKPISDARGEITMVAEVFRYCAG